MRHLRENVIYFTWCTNLFLSRFAIFCKKKKISHKNVVAIFFGILKKTCGTCGLVYAAVSVSHGRLREKIYKFPSFSRNKKSRTKVTKRGNLFIQTHKSTNWNRQGGHKAEIQVFDDQRTSFLLFMN